MVELGHLKEVDHAARAAAFGIWAAEDDAAEARVDDRAGTHGAGFLGDVEIAVGEAPIANCRFGLRDGEHLGMGCGVLEHFDLVPGPGDDVALADDNRADGDLVGSMGFAGLLEGFAHEGFVAGIFHNVTLLRIRGCTQSPS